MTSCNPNFEFTPPAFRPRHGAGRKTWALMAAHHAGGHGPHRGGPDFGFAGGPRGGGPFGRGGRRARRGDARLAALLLLAEEPRNGYAIMQELERRTDGVWRPSPGSIYPALAQLEDEGLIRSAEHQGGRVFEITDAGRESLAERPENAPAPWDTVSRGMAKESTGLFEQFRQLAAAVMQVAQGGNPELTKRTTAIIDEARRNVYRALADGDTPSSE